jgi:PAS domain-containing protein
MKDLTNEVNEHLQSLIDSVDELIVMKDGQSRWLAADRKARVLFQILDVDYRGKTDVELAVEVPAMRRSYPRWPIIMLGLERQASRFALRITLSHPMARRSMPKWRSRRTSMIKASSVQ